MLDYSINVKDREKFIIKYVSDKDKIIVTYADGRNVVFPYNIKLEKSLLESMREQVLDLKSRAFYNSNMSKIEKLNERKDFLDSLVLLNSIFFMIPPYSMINLIGLSSGFVLGGIFIGRDKYNINIIKEKTIDYYKNELFINNIELFQSDLLKKILDDKYIDLEMRRVLNEFILLSNSNDVNEIKRPNINDIDKVSTKTIENIYKMLKKEELNQDKKRALTKFK